MARASACHPEVTHKARGICINCYERGRRRNPSHRAGVLAGERRRHLRRTYGMTVEEYDYMLAQQNGVCAVCGNTEVRALKGKVMRLVVDHDHTTGEVRGLLCFACNAAIGLMRENAQYMRSAADYISKSSGI